LADPVSITKAKRIKPHLSAFDTLKPNRLEAELFTGVKIDTIADAKKAAQIMLDQGVKNVFISLGKDGILGANQSQMLHVSPFKTKIVNANGAGDCTMAAICWCRCHDIDSLQRIGWITQAAASLALESPRSVPEITPEKLDQKLTQVLLAN
jgi:pseudouridine kinase